jgi:hypothetical protein
MLAALRAVVEPPFRIVKRQFGYTKVRYRGLFKNGQQLYLLFALGNLYQVREGLMAIRASSRKTGGEGRKDRRWRAPIGEGKLTFFGW